MRDSGSDSDRGPAYCWVPRGPSGRQRQGKLRLRSTPSAFWRVRTATPSGLRSGTIQSWTPATGAPRSSLRATLMPAVSSPWMHPMTSATRLASELPSSNARIRWPRTERPRTTARVGVTSVARRDLGVARAVAATCRRGWAWQPPSASRLAASAAAVARSSIRDLDIAITTRSGRAPSTPAHADEYGRLLRPCDGALEDLADPAHVVLVV